jgi:two-component system sensor histidine kinase KdpD
VVAPRLGHRDRGACVATDWLIQGAMSESDLVMVFLMGVLVVARVFELGPALWAAMLAVAAFDVLFVEPRLTFAVDHTR